MAVFLAYDITLNKVGCPLIQAAMGGSPDLAKEFDSSRWVIQPTNDLKLYPIDSGDQLSYLLKRGKNE